MRVTSLPKDKKVLASPIKSKLAGSFKPKMTFKKRTYAETIDAYYIPTPIEK